MIFISSKISDGNMSLKYGDVKTALENKLKFYEKLKINPKNILEINQVHGNTVIVVNNISDFKREGDALITNRADIFLMIKTADCLPISLFDPINNAIGLIHAGYKGLEKGIIKKIIDGMKRNFRSDPKNLVVQFGPSIGPCHYRLDLWKDAENQFIKSGILKTNITNPKICTYENKQYFSHRRSVETNCEEGRFVTILGL